MPVILPKFQARHRDLLRDVRPVSVRLAEYMEQPSMVSITAGVAAGLCFGLPGVIPGYLDLIVLGFYLYLRWAVKRPFVLPLKFPMHAKLPDRNNRAPGKPGAGKSEGIMYLGNISDADDLAMGQELWLTNSDIRTHILYLGTTGSGKTEGLKALVTNALAWGSGYVYIDGKADTDLWASLFAVARRFGRDDDMLILNYMTGNSDDGSRSNTMNPFSNGSSSYLANMITNFMPDAGGDNAMWKERAVALMFALMPALVFKRDKQGMLMDIGTVRDNIQMPAIIRLSRNPDMPERIAHGLRGYLDTLPGYVDAAFDDDGNEKPPSPDQPMYDLQVARQQHGYLSMQFTRSLQMLADEYSYIFRAQLADVDVLDVVLNRRILITLIPALEKSGDEAANLGKIVAASLKGMMGMTLGNSVEGSWEDAIGSKQTRSASSFMTVFDEVGYYTAQGMAVMAAQARSLGFALVFAAQDLPSMEKRVKDEAKSIVGNCNMKLFGRIEDPTTTLEFINKHSGTSFVMEMTGSKAPTHTVSSLFMDLPFYDDRGANIQKRARVDYDHLKDQREGEVHFVYAEWVGRARMFYVNAEKVKALRVHRFLPIPPSTPSTATRDRAMNEMTSRLKDPAWTAAGASPAVVASPEIVALIKGLETGHDLLEASARAIVGLATVPVMRSASADDKTAKTASSSKGGSVAAALAAEAAEEDMAASVAMSKSAPVSIPDVSPSERAVLRATLPPLYEGDQYAFSEVEQAPAAATGATTRQGQSATQATSGFIPTNADLSVVTRLGDDDSGTGVLDMKLPDEVVALLAQSAQKLNKGLSGSDGRTAA